MCRAGSAAGASVNKHNRDPFRVSAFFNIKGVEVIYVEMKLVVGADVGVQGAHCVSAVFCCMYSSIKRREKAIYAEMKKGSLVGCLFGIKTTCF
jgi:hypothetical protein